MFFLQQSLYEKEPGASFAFQLLVLKTQKDMFDLCERSDKQVAVFERSPYSSRRIFMADLRQMEEITVPEEGLYKAFFDLCKFPPIEEFADVYSELG